MKKSKNILKFLPVRLLIGFLLLISAISVLSQFNWSGFGENSKKSKSVETTIKGGKIINTKKTETENFQTGKTLWDWLSLSGTLAIPIVLFQFQISEQRRAEKRAKAEKEQAEKREKFEKDIAEANLREEIFQAYIDRMAAILVDNQSRTELFSGRNGNSYEDNPVRDVARIRTVTILRRLENDTERQHRIIHFLHDTELLQFLLKTANLSGVNLSGANLSGANFSDVNFSGANLSEANFSDVNLYNVNFTNASLSGANLSEANLNGANFTNANLYGANLEKTDIRDTKFINTDLSNTRLVNAKTWYKEDAELNFYPDEYEEDGKYFPDYSNITFYETDFYGAKLTDANLTSTSLEAANNLTIEQLKEAKNWDEAIYNSELFKKLGLPKPLQSIIDTMYENVDYLDEDDDIDYEKLIGYQVEVRKNIDNETRTKTKGEITGFSKSNSYVNIKTLDGKQLDKIRIYEVYVYVNE
ncbi:MAG: pentapeptide repeat-containing protein [Cyanobacteria bacterium J06633_8]